MKVHENKDIFSREFVCLHVRAWQGERQTRVQEVPGPPNTPGSVGAHGQNHLSDKPFHELSPAGRMNPGGDHEEGKSAH